MVKDTKDIGLIISLSLHQNKWTALLNLASMEWDSHDQHSNVLFLSCLAFHQHASVSLERICSDKCTYCHTDIEVEN